MLYTVSCARPNLRYFNIRLSIPYITEPVVHLQLPSWRPGRYELGNFAKNIQGFRVMANGKALKYRKLNKDLWEIEAGGATDIEVHYNYYASDLNAGSTYVDEQMWYMNPVNCCMYVPGRTNEKHSLKLELPDGYKLGCSMANPDYGLLVAKNYEELADSPFIASPNLETHSFSLHGKPIHIHMLGIQYLDIEKLIHDFSRYSEEQASAFDEYPSSDFHYIFLFPPYRFHHGVEHMDSTVIMLGPSEHLHEQPLYNELLAVSSHEFYHLWNIKRIRPAEMLPYDYTKENYSQQGYVYEGVTTYMGDYTLLRSGVFSWMEYCQQFDSDLQRHFDNQGRFHYSVAESSFDTWLDGYVPGAPERKVNIYVEGMLAAFILDIEILYFSEGKYSIRDLMNRLYSTCYMKGTGYTEADYRRIAEELSGQDLGWYFEKVIHGRAEFEKYLPETLARIGCGISKQASPNLFERYTGAKVQTNGQVTIGNIITGSPAAEAGIAKGLRIISINGVSPVTQENLNSLSEAEELEIETTGAWGNAHFLVKRDGKTYYDEYSLVKLAEVTEAQKELFRKWSAHNW